MRKFLLTLCVVAALMPSFAADWVSAGGDFFVNKESVKRERNLVNFDLMQFNAYTGTEDTNSVSAVCLNSLFNGFDIEPPDTLSIRVNGEEFVAPKNHPYYKACSVACNFVPN